MIRWKVIFDNIEGNREIELNSHCKKGSEEDNIEYWLEHWTEFLKKNQGKGWKGYRVIKLERIE